LTMTPDSIPSLQPISDGIWRVRDIPDVSYPSDGLEECAAFEDVSFWFAHRNQVISSSLDRHGVSGRFVDVGGGNGFVSRMLGARGISAWLVEPDPAGVKIAHSRGVPVAICGVLESVCFPSDSFDAVGAFDVLEHIEDPLSVCREARRILRPGGHMLVTVPAWQLLWSQDDVRAGHFKRYSPRSLRHLLESAGLQVVQLQTFFSPLVLPILFLKSLPYRIGIKRRRPLSVAIADHQPKTGIIGKLMRRSLSRELSRHGKSNWLWSGSSLLAVATRPMDGGDH
jgi:SAM-dependent methyltransferase